MALQGRLPVLDQLTLSGPPPRPRSGEITETAKAAVISNVATKATFQMRGPALAVPAEVRLLHRSSAEGSSRDEAPGVGKAAVI